MPEYIIFTYHRCLAGGCESIVTRFWCVSSFDSLPDFEDTNRPGPGWKLLSTRKIFDWEYGNRLYRECDDNLWPVQWSKV